MVSQTESLGMVPRTPLDSVRKSTRGGGRATPGVSTKHAVPNSTRKTNRKQGRASKQVPPQPPQPSPEDLAHAGGLYFDMEGRPVFVEMKPATFYGGDLMRPFVKLDGENKRLTDRPCQPPLPNEPLIEWGKQVKWEKGGLLKTNSLKKPAQLKGSGPKPVKPRAAWQFYAEELILHATNARDRFEGDDLTVRQLIINEVRGLDKKRPRWTMPQSARGQAGIKGGKWAQLSAVEQEKYIKMHNEDVERYNKQMEAWRQSNSEDNSNTSHRALQNAPVSKK